MNTRLPEIFFDKRWGALIGGFQKTKAARFSFDGRRLWCGPTWRVRLFYPIVAAFLLVGLGRMLYVIWYERSSDGLQTGETVALIAAAVFVPVLLLQFVWAVRYERSFTWDFVAGSIEATRREFGARARLELRASEVAEVDVGTVRRQRGSKVSSGYIECHVLGLQLKDGQELTVLETTDPAVVAAVAEIITRESNVPLHGTLPA